MIFEVCACILKAMLVCVFGHGAMFNFRYQYFSSSWSEESHVYTVTLTSFQTVFSTENIAYREIFLEMLSK